MKNLLSILLLIFAFSCQSESINSQDQKNSDDLDSYSITRTIPNVELKKDEIKLSFHKANVKQSKADAVMVISNEITKHLGNIKEYNDDFSFRKLDSYDIIRETRILPKHGWVDIYEIVEKGSNSVGYINTLNPSWIEVGGTGTINLPPEEITNTVLRELEAFNVSIP